ncbi:MAG: putative Fe-S cluster assembly protein SufT [Gammaproteobacteria bacterium RIFCSPHIGHO2_12_FULL_40_19]|nr:MAG: putative Fe-S cluster assembly protein SufT [Gammaproteobacteria bacterium RIFCSPHIGHO2_12_FULL_40_19]
MFEKQIIILSRDCTALLVPSGARIMLHVGTEVTITQSLGSSYTVAVYGNLARIDGKDADALGKTPTNPLEELPENASIEDQVWLQLKSVYDPEIPVNIVDLGLVYKCEVIPDVNDNTGYVVKIEMTLTAPGCGMGPVIASDAKQKILAIPGIKSAEIEIVFDPPWDQSKMSDIAKLELGML